MARSSWLVALPPSLPAAGGDTRGRPRQYQIGTFGQARPYRFGRARTQGDAPLDYRLWTMDYGLWTIDYGPWTIDYGLSTMDYRLGTINHRLWTMDYGLSTIRPLPFNAPEVAAHHILVPEVALDVETASHGLSHHVAH